MCGHDTSSTPRVGARVDLFSRATSGPLGNLIFLDPSEPDSMVATHVRFTPEDDGLDADSQILVSIQSVLFVFCAHRVCEYRKLTWGETARLGI